MATLKDTTINDTGFVKLAVGTTAQRPTPSAGQMRFNSDTGKVEIYNSSTSTWLPSAVQGVIASGGSSVYDIDADGTTYRVHVFTAGTNDFIVNQGGEVEYLIVAGGGGGAGDQISALRSGGGGGAGGVLTGTTTVTPQTYTITVGAGGAGGSGSANGSNGGNSTAFGNTAISGGGGAYGSAASSGGSGGGGGGNTITPGSGTAGQGNSGGSGYRDGGNFAGGGGGGAGSQGASSGAGLPGANGGIGINSRILGFSTFFAGGGGGGTGESYSGQGLGGFGGGGNGAILGGTGFGATADTGGGGGGSGGRGGSALAQGGDGGGGIVVIRYPLQSEPTVKAPKVTDSGLILDLDFAKPTVYKDTTTTNITDSRSNEPDATLNGGITFANARTHRSTFSFDGVDDYIDLQTSYRLQLSGGTLIGWCYVEDFSTNTDVPSRIFVRNTSGYSSQIAFYEGGFGYETLTNSDPIDIASRQTPNHAAADITAGSWFCFALVFEGGGNAKGYVNGVEVYSDTTLNNNMDFRYLGINAGPANYPDYFKGEIGIVKLYDRDLSAAEILDFFDATKWRFGL